MRFRRRAVWPAERCVERTRSLRKRRHHVAGGLHLFIVAPNFNLIGFENGISLPQSCMTGVHDVAGCAGARNRVRGNMGSSGAEIHGASWFRGLRRQIRRNDAARRRVFRSTFDRWSRFQRLCGSSHPANSGLPSSEIVSVARDIFACAGARLAIRLREFARRRFHRACSNPHLSQMSLPVPRLNSFCGDVLPPAAGLPRRSARAIFRDARLGQIERRFFAHGVRWLRLRYSIAPSPERGSPRFRSRLSDSSCLPNPRLGRVPAGSAANVTCKHPSSERANPCPAARNRCDAAGRRHILQQIMLRQHRKFGVRGLKRSVPAASSAACLQLSIGYDSLTHPAGFINLQTSPPRP